MKVLVISTVWIEPASSAAGSRMLQLLEVFREVGWEVAYASTATDSAYACDLNAYDIRTEQITVNDSSFNAFAKAYNPNIVLFDRFLAEEQFGWRIAEECPNALKILDTEDLHCLRKARALSIKENVPFTTDRLISDIAKREIASIYRCDLTLMISSYEIELLQNFFKVPEFLLNYIPFLLPALAPNFKSYEDREHFVSIGNFLHEPNWDATLQLKQIWPYIRKELPKVALHVYGAYSSEKVMQLHNPKEGFLIKGRAISAEQVIGDARVLLAPLRFGAGLKGKFIDAMQCGTPSVTTNIGVEGMSNSLPWAGQVVDDDDAFVNAAIELYTNKQQWVQAQENGTKIINTNFQKNDFGVDLVARIKEVRNDLAAHRKQNFTGQMLLHHTMRSTKFMSKWIEEKNK